MMKAGVDVTVTEIDKSSPFTIFNGFNYYFQMATKGHSSYSFTFSSIIAIWLHENIAPIADGKWIIHPKLDGARTGIEIYFKDEKDATFFKLTWGGA